MSDGTQAWCGTGTEVRIGKKALNDAVPSPASATPCPVDEITAALIDPATGEPDTKAAVLYGYLWRGKDKVHLYLTWFLDEYVDLTGVPILFWRKIPYDGGTLVWVRRDTTIRHISLQAPEEEGHRVFLSGSIADAYLNGAPTDLGMTSAAGRASFAPDTATCLTSPCRP